MSSSSVDPFDYPLKSIHYLVATKNHKALSATISSLPRLDDPILVATSKVSTSQEEIFDSFSSNLNSRDNDKRDTPLHIAVRLSDSDSVKILLSVAGGADVTIRNARGWTPLQEAILRDSSGSGAEIIKLLVSHQRQVLWYKWRRRLPLISKTLKVEVPDFFLQITVGIESTVISVPQFPTQTIKVWKHGGNFIVDTPVITCVDDLNPKVFARLERKRIVFISHGNKSIGGCSGAGEYALLVKNDGKKSSSEPIDLIEKMQKPTNTSDFENALGRKKATRIKIDMSKGKFIETKRRWCIFRKSKDVGKWRNCKVYKGKKFAVSYYVWSKRHSKGQEPEVVGEVTTEENVNPSIWVNEEFPLKIDAMEPMISILGEETRDLAILIHLLKATGTNTFPVKVSFPIILTLNLVAKVTAFSSKPRECGDDPFDEA